MYWNEVSGPLTVVCWVLPVAVKLKCSLASQRTSSSTPLARVPVGVPVMPVSWVRFWR
jgi:hypothetical protein